MAGGNRDNKFFSSIYESPACALGESAATALCKQSEHVVSVHCHWGY